MKNMKIKSLSLVIMLSIAFSSSTVYPGIFSFLFGKSKPVKTSSSSGTILKWAAGTGLVAFTYLFLRSLFESDPAGPDMPNPSDDNDVDLRVLATEGVAEIPEYLVPHVRNSRKHGEIDYIQLHTVDQFAPRVTRHVRTHLNEIRSGYNRNKDNEEKRNGGPRENEIKKIKNKYRQDYNDFSTDATCPSQSIRNAYFMCEMLATQHPQNKGYFLNIINDEENAANYLRGMVNANIPTSWLLGGEVRRRVGTMPFVGGVVFPNRVTIIENLFEDHTFGMLGDVAARFRNPGDYFHLFITTNVDPALVNNQGQGSGCSSSLLEQSQARTHWYVIALSKEGDNYKCFIIDTIPNNDHISTRTLLRVRRRNNRLRRARFLCEQIIYGDSIVAFDQGEGWLMRPIVDPVVVTQENEETSITDQSTDTVIIPDNKVIGKKTTSDLSKTLPDIINNKKIGNKIDKLVGDRKRSNSLPKESSNKKTLDKKKIENKK